MKKIQRIAAALLSVLLLAGCAAPAGDGGEDGRVKVVATLFPQYDFARQIAGEHADVTLLLPPGVESHSYEPPPADIIMIGKADLFLYTGEYMEPWAEKILAGAGEGVRAVDLSAHVTLEKDDDGDGHDHGGYDPHIWTDPQNAKIMVDDIAAALCAADPGNAGEYQTAAAEYKERLDALDERFSEVVETGKRREIVFGGRFALHYFAERYGLTCISAFDSCSGETEPSAGAVAQIIRAIETDGVPVIYYEELTDPKVARSIAEETGAKPLLLHSCHNVSREELQNGATYLSLMEQNVENLREGLN